jgi:uncharacterized protein (TIGR01777 family)
MGVVIAGAGGMIGTALIAALEDAGHDVTRLVRPGSEAPGITWDPAGGTIDASGLEGHDAVVNLAGRGIGERRWTAAERKLVYHSRVDGTRLLATALAGLQQPPQVLVNASAVGYYGERGTTVLTASDGPGEGFLARVCVDWEAATAPAAASGIRVVNLRTGMVLGPGGALGRILAPFGPSWLSPYRWGLGGWIGSGRQMVSWIGLDDAVRAIVHLLDSSLAGPVNVTAPEPVSNRVFLRAVGRTLRRPVWFPIPGFVMRLFLGSDLARALLLEGQAAIPERLVDDGFEFSVPDLDAALDRALNG